MSVTNADVLFLIVGKHLVLNGFSKNPQNRWRSQAFFFGGAAPLLPGFDGAVAYPQRLVWETHEKKQKTWC